MKNRKNDLYGIEGTANSVKKLQAIKICPITSGLPTTMTLEGFQAACERSREQDRHNYDGQRAYKYTWCDTCQGRKMPKELRIVPLSQLRERREAKRRSQEMRQHPLAG